MMPISLRFAAFGPYVKQQFVDFKKFSDVGLFLIHGETGSGKTVILDGITYALYGKSSGGGRGDILDMRCDKADPSEETWIEFVFSVRGKQYKFYRSLKGHRKKNSGEIEYRSEQNAFVMDEGHYVSCAQGIGVKNIQTQAESIIGLTYEQFRQVIILPQGQFEKLLLSKSEEKENLLVTLFDAGKWQEAAEWIYAKGKEKSDEIKQEQGILNAMILGQECDSLEGLLEKERITGEELRNKEEEKRKAKLALKSEKNLHDNMKELFNQFLEYEKVRADLQQELEKEPAIDLEKQMLFKGKAASSLTPDFHKIKEMKHEQKSGEENLKTQEEQQKILLENLALWEQKEKDLLLEKEAQNSRKELTGKYKGMLGIYEKEASARLFCMQKSKSFDALSKLFDEKNEALKQLLEKKKIWNKEKEHIIEFYVASLPSLRDSLYQLEQGKKIQQECDALKKEIKRFREAEEKQEWIKAESLRLQGVLEKNSERIRGNYLLNAAGVLAEHLKENLPCPVCGSVHHPQKAAIVSGENSLEEVKAAQKALEEMKRQVEDLAQNLMELRLKRESLEKECKSKETDLENQEVVFSKELYVKAKEQLETAQNEVNKLPEITKSIELIGEEVSALNLQLERMELEKNIAAEKRDQSKAEHNAILMQLDPQIENKNGLDAALEKIEKEINHYETELANAQKETSDANVKVSKVQVAIEFGAAQKERLVLELQHLEESFAQSLRESGFIDLAAFEQSILSETQISSLQQKIADHKANKKALIQKQEMMQRLLLGREKPDLQRQENLVLELEKQKTKLDEICAVLKGKWEVCNELISLLKERQKSIQRRQKEAEKMLIFGKMLRGDTGISLRRYVLGVMLAAVTTEANLLLKNVHQGRYQLYTTMEGSGRNRKAGLDLEVMDHSSIHCGKRSVASLSGGEKFLVALSLSLGLSAVVEKRSGGVRMDAMFIDEGFGSLDPSSIEDALSVLSCVKGSRRLVGIISHVSFLKETIEASIQIEKDRQGSNLMMKI